MENFETILILETLARKRSARLSDIATKRLIDGLGWPAEDRYTIAVEQDNAATDFEIRQHFKGYPSQVTECHTRACNESGVEFCVCMPDTQIKGGVL